jgi:hypothetical protein
MHSFVWVYCLLHRLGLINSPPTKSLSLPFSPVSSICRCWSHFWLPVSRVNLGFTVLWGVRAQKRGTKSLEKSLDGQLRGDLSLYLSSLRSDASDRARAYFSRNHNSTSFNQLSTRLSVHELLSASIALGIRVVFQPFQPSHLEHYTRLICPTNSR